MKITRKSIRWIIAGVVALALVVLIAYKMSRPDEVAVTKVQAQTIELALSVIGRVHPENMVQVSSPNPGQVVRLLADDGDTVAQGTPLAVIKSQVEQAQTEADIARERAARADVTEARLNYNRTRTLHERGFAADAALDNARIAVQAAEANLAAASAQVKASSVRAGEFTIRAPMAGIVLFRPLDSGQVVAAGETIFELASSGGAEVQAEVEEVYADTLKQGMIARAALSGSDAVFQATLFEVSPRVNASTGARLIKLRPEQNAALSPGRSIDLTIIVETRQNAISLPRSAVADATTTPKVFVVDANNKVQVREVQVERWPSTNAIITRGLKVGDLVVRDAAQVEAGQRIRPMTPSEG